MNIKQKLNTLLNTSMGRLKKKVETICEIIFVLVVSSYFIAIIYCIVKLLK